MAKIKIVFGTGGGNTEMVCRQVAEIWQEAGHDVEMLQAKITEPEEIGERDLLVLASPTYGHGLLEAYFAKFMKKLEAVELEGEPCAIIGLGDPKYDDDYHIESVKIISDFLKKKEAKIVGMPLRVSRCPLPLMKEFVPMWAKNMVLKIEQL